MKRDFDVIRRLLLKCEESTDHWFTIGIIEEIPQIGEDTLRSSLSEDERYHIDLMAEAGLVRKENVVHPGIGYPEKAEVMYKVTWVGHDYLDAVRDEGIWKKTKDAVANQGGNAAFEIMKALALGLARKQIEERTGIRL